jgi:hypothetical protein
MVEFVREILELISAATDSPPESSDELLILFPNDNLPKPFLNESFAHDKSWGGKVASRFECNTIGICMAPVVEK